MTDRDPIERYENEKALLGVVPDIADAHLDLTKDQKLRMAALMLAIRYHVDTIIKDARYLELMLQKEKEAKFSNDPDAAIWHLNPSTTERVVQIAQSFESFLRGPSIDEERKPRGA